MYYPSLPLLRQVIGPSITGLAVEIVQSGPSPSTVYRVTLQAAQGHPELRSVILKAIAPEWPDDPRGVERERRFYGELFPRLGLAHPRVYYAGIEPQSSHSVIILEDLAPTHTFPPKTHCWSAAEAFCLLRAYARLHASAQRCLPPPSDRQWLKARWESYLDHGDIPRMADELTARGLWGPLPQLERLVEKTRRDIPRLSNQAVTLLHNDAYPPNVGLPTDERGEAFLIDWSMLSWGLAELDLAYLFMQPFRSTRYVNKPAALDHYWAERARLEGGRPSPDECQERQRHADAVLALALLTVGYQRSFPIDSAPWVYWSAMYGVLHERLTELCADL
jgi:hypothetical protein